MTGKVRNDDPVSSRQAVYLGSKQGTTDAPSMNQYYRPAATRIPVGELNAGRLLLYF